jgi:predicted RNA-binding protein (TIGR00451 family)
MLPGLAGPPSSPDLQPGDMIGIKATGSDEILGVGRCAVAGADMKRSRKGKAVEMIHCWKDRCGRPV